MAVLIKEKLRIREIKWKVRACKRCGGDMYNDGERWNCLQCSGEYQRGYKPIKYTTGRKGKWE
jgi:ribosomal protein S27AE